MTTDSSAFCVNKKRTNHRTKVRTECFAILSLQSDHCGVRLGARAWFDICILGWAPGFGANQETESRVIWQRLDFQIKGETDVGTAFVHVKHTRR